MLPFHGILCNAKGDCHRDIQARNSGVAGGKWACAKSHQKFKPKQQNFLTGAPFLPRAPQTLATPLRQLCPHVHTDIECYSSHPV